MGFASWYIGAGETANQHDLGSNLEMNVLFVVTLAGSSYEALGKFECQFGFKIPFHITTVSYSSKNVMVAGNLRTIRR